MKRIDEIIEEALHAAEPSIANDGFCERVVSRLPRKKRAVDGSLARRLSLVAAACIGSVLTLMLGAPFEDLFAGYVELAGPASTLIGASIALGILVVPIVWLMCTEAAARR